MLLILLPASACGATPGIRSEFQGTDEDTREELEILRAAYIKTKRQNIQLKLDNARGKPDYEEERRVLIEEGLGDPYAEIQVFALSELAALPGDRREMAVPGVLKVSAALDPKGTAAAMGFLSRAGTKEAEEAILSATRHDSAVVRRAAAEALKRSANNEAIEKLHTLLSDPDLEVRFAAIDAIGTIRNARSVKPLAGFVEESGEIRLKEKAIDALGNIGHPDALDVLLMVLRQAVPVGEDWRGVHWSAISSFGRIVVANERGIGEKLGAGKRAIRPFLDRKHPIHLREIAIQSLGKFKDPDLGFTLADQLVSKQPRLRTAAFHALVLIVKEEILNQDLLPAYTAERDEGALRSMWGELTKLAEKDFDRSARIAETLVEHPRFLSQAEEMTAALKKFDPGTGMDRKRRLDLVLIGIAKAQEMAEEYLLAVGHYRDLSKRLPKEWEHLRRAAHGYRKLKEFDMALNMLLPAIERAEMGGLDWWNLQVESLKVRVEIGNPVELVDASFPLLKPNPHAPPEATRKEVRGFYNRGVKALFRRLDHAKEAAGAVGSLKKLGRKVLEPMASALEDASHPLRHGALIEIGNSIAGTAYPTTAGEARRKKAAASWRDFLAKP